MIIRSLFLLIVVVCIVLYKVNQTDYIILLIPVVGVAGIFSITDVELAREELQIRKSYFWALISLKWSIAYSQVLRWEKRDEPIFVEYPSDDIFTMIGNTFSDPPQARYKRIKIHYLSNGIEKDMEIKVGKDDCWDIERKLDYQAYLKMKGNTKM